MWDQMIDQKSDVSREIVDRCMVFEFIEASSKLSFTVLYALININRKLTIIVAAT